MSTNDAEPATKGDLVVLRDDLGVVRNDLGILRGDVGVLRADLGAVRDDVGVLRADLGAVRGDVGILRGDLEMFREEMTSKTGSLAAEIKATHDNLDNKIDKVHRSLAIEIVKTNGRIDLLDESFSAKLSDGVSKILKVVQDFMTQVQKVDRHQIITSYRIDEIEKRVKFLES